MLPDDCTLEMLDKPCYTEFCVGISLYVTDTGDKVFTSGPPGLFNSVNGLQGTDDSLWWS